MSTTAPQGFRAAGVAAGLKTSGRPDVALVVNDGPDYHAAAVFTSNRVEAAPVTWSRQVVTDGRADAVALNSGGANACTGPAGFADTHHTAEHVAELLGVGPIEVAGPLDFELVGVMHELLTPLVPERISMLAMSTYDTDWVLVPTERSDDAANAWRRAGFVVTPTSLSSWQPPKEDA